MMLLWLVIVVIAAAAAARLAWRTAKTHLGRQLESAEARWQLQHQQDSPGTVIECVTLGWMNLLIQSLWGPVLEKHVSGLTTELLGKVFFEVLSKNSHKAPWKYLDSIAVEELSFGLVPPTFHAAQVKYDPSTSLLTLNMDVRFTSSSAQAVLLVKSKAVGLLLSPVTVRLEATHVKLRGKLRLGILLGPEPPGIQGVFYSFSSPPHLDVAVRPLGMPLPAVLPGVDTALRGVLSKLISRRLVEPQRRYFDVHRMYLNKHIARVGGPAGLLKVVVVCATHLAGKDHTQQQQQQPAGSAKGGQSGLTGAFTSADTKQSGSSGANGSGPGVGKLSTYCELHFNGAVLRTPIAHHAANVDALWNWQFSLPLQAELTSAAAAGGGGGGSRSGSLLLAVLDAQTVGEPATLGRSKVSLPALDLQPNGAARTLVLPLLKCASPGASIEISLQWLKSTKPPARPVQATTQQQPSQQAGSPSPSSPLPPTGRSIQQGQQLGRMQQAAAAGAPVGQCVGQEPSCGVSTGSEARQPQCRTQTSSISSIGSFGADEGSHHDKSSSAPRDSLSLSGNLAGLQRGASPPLPPPSPGGAAAAGGTVAASARSTSSHLPDTAGRGGTGVTWAAAGRSSKVSRCSSRAAGDVDSDGDLSFPQLLPAARQGQGTGPRPGAPRSAAAAASVTEPGAARGSGLLSGGPSRRSWAGWLWGSSGGGLDDADEAYANGHAGSAGSVIKAQSEGGAALGTGSSRPTSPWGRPAASVAGAAGALSGATGPGAAGGGSDGGGTGGNALALLTHVVRMQKELEQQRQQLQATQQQLAHTDNRYCSLKQQCRQRGRAALQQGGHFLLHRADGTSQNVLLYLTAPAAAVATVNGHAAGGSAQPQQEPLLVLAALPQTRREARLAWKRMVASTGAAAGNNHSLSVGAGDRTGQSGGGAAVPAAHAAGNSTTRVGTGAGTGSVAAAAASSSGVGGPDETVMLAGSSHAGGPAAAGGGAAVGAGATERLLSGLSGVGAGIRLRLQQGTVLQWGYESGKIPRAALQQLKVIPIVRLVGIVRGTKHFPAAATAAAVAGLGGSGVSGSSTSRAAAECCFTLLVQEDAGGAQVIGFNMQLPPVVGNGRALDEWVLALRDLAEPSATAALPGQGHTAASTGVPAVMRQVQAVPVLQSAPAFSAGPAGLPAVAAVAAASGEREQPGSVVSNGPAGAFQRAPGSLSQAAPAAAAAAGRAASSSGGGDASGSNAGMVATAATDEDGSNNGSAGGSPERRKSKSKSWLLPVALRASPRPWPGPAGGVGDGDGASSSNSGGDSDSSSDSDVK